MRLYWGPVLIGAIAGFVVGSVIGLPLIAIVDEGISRQIILILVLFLIELGAGFVAGRFSPTAQGFNGSQAALLLYALGGVVALGNGADLASLVLGAALALFIGTLGGFLAVAVTGPSST